MMDKHTYRADVKSAIERVFRRYDRSGPHAWPVSGVPAAVVGMDELTTLVSSVVASYGGVRSDAATGMVPGLPRPVLGRAAVPSDTLVRRHDVRGRK